MSFSEFQTDTATMKKITTDGAGDETVASSFTVDIDPVFGFQRVYTQDDVAVTGRSTVISPHDSIDVTHNNWKITYNGTDYDVEELTPFYRIGTDTLESVQVILR